MDTIGPMKMKKPKPSISLDEQDLPAIKNWKVGDTYNVTAKVKLTFQSEGREYESDYPMEGSSDQSKMRARFKIISIEPVKEEKKKVGKKLPRVKY